MNPTSPTFGGLLTDAAADLDAVHALLTARPNNTQTTPPPTRDIQDVAAALHTLGTTVGEHSPQAQHLHQTLHVVGIDFGDHTHSEPGLTRAAAAIRAAAELLATNGPLNPGDAPKARHPRPTHLTDPRSRAGVWSTIAGLTNQLVRIARTSDNPDSVQLAESWQRAATAIPNAGIPIGMAIATPSQGVPLAPRARSRELDGRIHELTTIAYRTTDPTAPGPAALTLQGLAGFAIRTYRASTAAVPAHARDFEHRARQWSRVYAALAAISTPTVPPPHHDTTAIRRATQLLGDKPSPNDLTRARTAACQIAPWLSNAIGHLPSAHTAVVDGSRLPALIAAATPNLNHARMTGTTVPFQPGDTQRVQVMLTHVRRPLAIDVRGLTIQTINLAPATAGRTR